MEEEKKEEETAVSRVRAKGKVPGNHEGCSGDTQGNCLLKSTFCLTQEDLTKRRRVLY